MSENIVRSPLPALEYDAVPVGQYVAQELSKFDQNVDAIIEAKTGLKLTRGQLFARSQSLAVTLLDLEVGEQDSLVFYADNSVEYLVGIFSSLYLGLPMVQCRSADGPFEVAQQIRDTQATIVVTSAAKMSVLQRILDVPEYAQALTQVKLFLVLECEQTNLSSTFTEHPLVAERKVLTFQKAAEANRKLDQIPHFTPQDLSKRHCLITFTSGTTGKPKAAVQSHESTLSWLVNFHFKESLIGKLIGIANPLGHISGTIFTITSLLDGMTVVLFDRPSVDAIMSTVERLKVNQLVFGSNNASELASEPFEVKYDLGSLEMMKYGSSKVAANLLLQIKEKYKVRMYEIYGATEFFGHLEYRDLDELDRSFTPHNLGTPVPGVEMKIVDLSTGQALPANAPGEICFRGRQCFIGYLNNPVATAATIDTEGWYHSGDVGYYTEAGNLFTSDRIKELIKYAIWSVAPAEIEDFLHRHPAVDAVCVIGVPHLTDGYLIRAYVVRKKGMDVSEGELMQYVKDNLGFQKRLRGGVRFIEKMAVTPVGKNDRQFFKSLVKDELLTESVE